MKIKCVTVDEVEYIASCLSRHWPEYSETDRDCSTCFPEALDGCILAIQSPRVKGFAAKAALFFYQLLKKRPFRNGNKRIALAALFHFLYKNGRWIAIDAARLLELAQWTSQSPDDVKEETLRGVERFLNRHLISFHEPAETPAVPEKAAEPVEQLDLVLA